MTRGTFGESLRREREMRGVTLEEISSATRISKRFLQAIEDEEWSQLPGGVFNRGFVRAVAHYLGLDEEDLVAEYALAVDESQSVPVWTGSPPAVAADKPWLAWTVAAVVAVVLLTGGWLGVRQLLAWRAARRSTIHATIAVVFPSAPSDAPPQSTVTPLKDGGSASPSNLQGATPQMRDRNTSLATSAAAADPPAVVAPNRPASDSFALTIEAVKKTKVTVAADSSQVFDETMEPGETRVFSAKDHFDVSAEDAGAVLLQINGKALAPIGLTGHPAKVTLNQEALRKALGGGN